MSWSVSFIEHCSQYIEHPHLPVNILRGYSELKAFHRVSVSYIIFCVILLKVVVFR